jgi:hypothetical protein
MLKSKVLVFFLSGFLFFSCSGNLIPDDKFIGTWEMKGRGMFEGIQIRIVKEDGKLIGKILRLNDNKFIKMFADSNDVWVSEIRRTSDFEFKLTEKKIAKDLFSLYGLSTSQEYKAEFIDDNTIGLGMDNSDPLQSSLVYKRIAK